MLVRRIARSLLAAGFVADGVDAVRNPEPHVAHAEAALRRLRSRLDLPEVDHDRLTALVRAHGALVTVSAAALAVGRAPRTAALALAVLTVPVAVVDVPLGGDDDQAPGTLSGTGDTRAQVERLLRRLSLIGATVIAAVDLEGRPGLAWRTTHARVDRAAAKEAREAVAEARKEVRAALRDARRAAA